MSEQARAFWVAAPGRGELRPAPLPEPGPDDLVVRALASAISRGSERLVFLGRVPPAVADSLRAPFQEGLFPAPVKYGYCMVGRVEVGPPGLAGRRVFCLHPHQERMVVPAAAAVPVPDAVPTARATLAANMETAVNVLWDAGATVGQRITVVGAGVVGCLIAFLAARLPGAEVELIDVAPPRRAVAERLGAGFALPGDAAGDRDLVIHASGDPDGLVTALGLAGLEATVVEVSWYGTQPVSLPLGAAFHARRLRLVASQVGMVAGTMRPRWSRRQRLQLALALLGDDRLDALLTGESRFVDLPAVMKRLATAADDDTLCHVVRYDEAPDPSGAPPCTA